MNSASLRPSRHALLLLLLTVHGFHAAADMDSYQDDYTEEEVEGASSPGFTYSFSVNSAEEQPSPFVRPSDPRYYQDTRGSPGVPEKESWGPEKREGDGEEEERRGWELHDQTSSTTAAESLNDSSVSRVMVPDLAGSTIDIYFIAIVAGCSAAAAVAIIGIAIGWCRWQRRVKAAADVEYPAYGVTGPNKEVSPTGDRRLAHSAQMYHYQHQKQQILAMESSTRSSNDRNGSVSDPDSEEENEEGDYTVYECPGPAPIGEMEVRNPLFLDDPTPATPPQGRQNGAAAPAK